MIRFGRVAAALVALVAGAGATAGAQSATDLLARGIQATRNLEYDSAATLLRSALNRPGPAALPDSAQARGLMYLGATEFFREHRDSAAAAFRRLLLLAPRFRPDQLIFPPEVSGLFEEVRIGTQAVAVSLAPVTDIRMAGDRLVARLYASSLHMITASVVRGNGAAVRTLYNGAIGDSLEVLWDGRDSTGAPADSGSYLLRVASRGTTARVVRLVEVPLLLRVAAADSAPPPLPIPDSLLLPESAAPQGGGKRPLLIGLAGTVAALALPAFTGAGEQATGARFVVGTATAIAGLVGFRAARRPQPIPANIAANESRRLAWQRDAEAVRADNAARRLERRLTIRAGAPRVVAVP